MHALFEAQCTTAPFDAVINLAARAGVRQSVENPWVYINTNAIGTLNLLELCRKHGVGKFIPASTSSLYGKDNTMPYREDQDTNYLLSPYAASKKATEAMCYTYHYLYDIDVTVFRYFTVYGPAGCPDMSLFRFTQWISAGRPVTVYGDGTQKRDFTYVDDIARRTVASLKSVGYEVINLGPDCPVALMYTIHLIEELTGQTANLEYKPVHAGRSYKKLTPYVPAHQALRDAFLTRFWDYYRELRTYQQAPTLTERERLSAAFDILFATRTGYDRLDRQIVKTQAQKAPLLRVMAHPELPLHNNVAELAVRQRVRKRDVSFGPRSEAGKEAWDTFMTLAETTRKLCVSFYAYLRDRILTAHSIPPLADLIAQAAQSLHLGDSWAAP